MSKYLSIYRLYIVTYIIDIYIHRHSWKIKVDFKISNAKLYNQILCTQKITYHVGQILRH